MKVVTAKGYQMISKEAVSAFLTEWDSFFDIHNPSFFEITTAMAFDFFAKEKVDIAVIETGLGGRLDATNTVANPILTVITEIGYDHMQYLGNTIEEIAKENGSKTI